MIIWEKTNTIYLKCNIKFNKHQIGMSFKFTACDAIATTYFDETNMSQVYDLRRHVTRVPFYKTCGTKLIFLILIR